MGIVDDGRLRPAEEVDEAGRDDLVARVDGRFRLDRGQVADRNDGVTAHADISAKPGGAGAVEDPAVGDFQIEHVVWFRIRGRTGRGEKDEKGDGAESQSLKVAKSQSGIRANSIFETLRL